MKLKVRTHLEQLENTMTQMADVPEAETSGLISTLRRVGKLFSYKLLDTAISAYAGQAAFMMILSFFPFIMFLLTLLKFLPLSPELFITTVESFMPSSFRDFITSVINQIYASQSSTVLPLTVITALWLGSRSFLSIIYGLNSVYDIPETRNYLLLRLTAMLYTLLFALLIIGTLLMLVFGNQLFYRLTQMFPLLTHILLPIISFRSAVSFFIMLIFFTAMYVFIPNHKLHGNYEEWFPEETEYRKRSVSILSQFPGALLATTGWLTFSYLYSYYVDHISNYASFYGTMTVIALLMVWIYACMYILFFGGWLNYLLYQLLHDSGHMPEA